MGLAQGMSAHYGTPGCEWRKDRIRLGEAMLPTKRQRPDESRPAADPALPRRSQSLRIIMESPETIPDRFTARPAFALLIGLRS